ncbi:peptidase U32 family protein [Desulfosporosinus lacus]|uniref:Collagenase-like protease, PrtC family n=1 Tax=Desulfosporosinus lacus DSM 15449 TaxID=1121420 RepID=A0A1M6FPM0_9FIRM|nr:U32 family peptidase [Desulfosporosinus lacus]SHI99616.1 Collagenase-like protease, PrtC family [Desulfosporosinus lacus DSM 15449]
MKILAPVSSIHEVEVLTSKGADELYCGVSLEAWENKHGQDVWLSRRGPGKANIRNLDTLSELVDKAHHNGAKVFLTLNQPGYVKELATEILSFVQEVRRNCVVDGFIVADPGLIRTLKEKEQDTVIHVSSLAAVLNSSSVNFFRKLGVERIIFPRYLDVNTLRKIIAVGGTDMEYEVFILNDGCVFEEGYCNVSHAYGGAFCHNPAWAYKLISIDGEEVGGNIRKARNFKGVEESFCQSVDEYKRWLWVGIKNFGGLSGSNGYPLGMCGLCTLPEYEELGITSLKIVGREAPFRKKVKSVELVKRILDYVKEGHPPEEVREYAKNIKGVRGLCETGYMCYDR